MDSTSRCTVCHSNNSNVFPSTLSGKLGRGLTIEIDKLETTAASGCRWCTLLSNSLAVLSPNFEMFYHGRKPKRLYVQKSETGSLLVALDITDRVYVDHLDIYTHIDCQLLWGAIGCAADVPESLTMALATKKIKLWMSGCRQHPECKTTDHNLSELPTRVLLLGKHKVSLQETAGQRGFYATLSHCWGTSQVLKTTKETLDQRKSTIRWDSLPRIFQDAISLARDLGIKYLWIDSLCIIQGDSADWLRESSRMVDIYANSYLNFATTSSSGSHGTLFSERWTTPIALDVDIETLPKRPMKSYCIPCSSDKSIIKTRYSTRPAHENIKLFHNSGHEKRSDVFQKGPLLTRSWVFQERLLSPRTIHFHASEMVWECKNRFICECGVLQKEEASFHDDYPVVGKRWLHLMEEGIIGDYSFEDRWLDGVELYSRLRITNCTDKLPALSGLANRFAIQLQSRYLARLWECDLPRSLCWTVVGEEEDGPYTLTRWKYGKRCNPYCAPTWSWVSIDLSNTGITSSFEARTAFGDLLDETFSVDERYELIAVECIAHPDSPFGHVTSGVLKIRAAVLSTILYDEQLGPQVCRLIIANNHYAVDMDIDIEHLTFERCHEPPQMEVLLLLLGGHLHYEYPYNFALVLRLVGVSPERYERVGIVKLPESELNFLNAEIRIIEVV